MEEIRFIEWREEDGNINIFILKLQNIQYYVAQKSMHVFPTFESDIG